MSPSAAAVASPAAAAAAAASYAHNPQMRALRHWEHMPVRVYFVRSDNSGGDAYSDERRRLALAGFDEWSAATGGRLWYREVDKASDADVTVRFLPGAYVPPETHTLGRTEYFCRRDTLVRAQMVLATKNVRPAELTEAAAHEWGHALGIDGHSDDPDDLMYGVSVRYVSNDPDFVPPVPPRTITPRDLATIEAAYPQLFRAHAPAPDEDSAARRPARQRMARAIPTVAE